VILCAHSDPLAGRRSVRLEELGERPWLLREEGSGTRTLTEDFLASHDLRPPTLTLGSNGAIKQAARAGLGVALQSRLAAGLELELGLLATIAVDVPLPRRHWYLLHPARSRPRSAVEEFVAFARGANGRRAIAEAAHAWAAARGSVHADP
jgi:DNA-binding transcriptional LysR family regulator